MIELPHGWHEDVPMDTYIADPALSSSGEVKMDLTPKTYAHDLQRERTETKAMIEGVALHLAVLEPNTFDGHYIVLGQCEAIKKGDGERCTNPGVYYRGGASYCGARSHDPYDKEPMAEGIYVLQEDQMDKLFQATKAVLGHKIASRYFSGKGRSELTGVWTDPDTGVRCKIRIDRELSRAAHHCDLKYTADISDEGFKRQAGKMGWVRRSAFYRRGMAHLGNPAEASIIIAAQNGAPHDCRTFLLDEGDIAAFADTISGNLAKYATCLDTDEWPGYPQILEPMKLKPWDLPYKPPTDDFGGET